MNINNSLKNLLTSGCDERIIFPDGSNHNNYFMNPFNYTGLISRGSCTCGSLNRETYNILKDIKIIRFENNFDEIVQIHAKQLKKLFHLPGKPDFEIFFAPSGSHLVYYQLLFSALLYPENQPINFLTCPEELGSGTQIAAHGKHFSVLNQFGESISINSDISENIQPKVVMLPARDKAGHIVDNRAKLKQLISKYKGLPKIVSLVFGSKSGIEDNLFIIDEIEATNTIWTVDLCQFRNKKDLINSLLSKGYILLITGSKFYQAPPFCGALLVPKDICNRLVECKAAPAKEFKNIFSKYDIPECLPEIRKQLRDYKNLGLHLRWKCALHEMIEYDKIGEEKTYSMILKWNEFINKTLRNSEYFDLMPDMELTNKTIISFRLKKNGHYFDNSELKNLFKNIVSKNHPEVEGFDRVFIGQPVKYETGSFLRLAISSFNVRQFIRKNTNNFINDLNIIKIIENEVRDAQ
jgi:hypothetical protein